MQEPSYASRGSFFISLVNHKTLDIQMCEDEASHHNKILSLHPSLRDRVIRVRHKTHYKLKKKRKHNHYVPGL